MYAYLMKFIIIGLMILLGVAVTQVLTENCDANVVVEILKSCHTVGISEDTTAAMINTLCQNAECTIRCVTDAVGTCYKNDAFFNYDPAFVKVLYRLICNNSQAMTDVLKQCATQMFANGTCFSSFKGPFVTANQDLLNGNYNSYKTAACKYNFIIFPDIS
ncbi:uncharacterized protein LOC127831608 [Dreissena polymorpha]|uniref:uncharacterized protein LOC127831608 n=1 Tax=Dreissena polymorpha TaxID=45954 RepID=UPI002264DF40|nr:uncharacterized protein LOC127831608 [Dreissena polymorpha]